MKHTIFFCFNVLVFILKPSAQINTVHINFSIKTNQLDHLTFQKLGLKSHLQYVPDFEYPLQKNTNSAIDFKFKQVGLYKILDGFDGHIIYLENDDSVKLKLEEIKNLASLSQKKYYPAFHTLKASGKYYWHYTFFDELYKRTVHLQKFDINVHLKKLMLFKSNCDIALSIGENLLDSLYKKNRVSINFKRVVAQELNAIYVSWMCSPLYTISKNKVPQTYFEKLDSMKFNDSVYAVQCNDYIQAGALYTYYLHNNYQVGQKHLNLNNEIKTILLNYTGIIKDKLLSWQITDYLDKDYPGFDSCYQVYLKECKNAKLKNETIKKVNAYVKPLKKISNMVFDDLMVRSKVQDYKDVSQSLHSLLKDSVITLIDCWASWCIPCRDQMPFVHDVEKKYSDKLRVMYLSFDKDEAKWKAFINKNKLKLNQYLIDNDFSSEFSQYFNMQTIPRYILISKGGIKVLNANMPLPSMENEFEMEIKKHFE